MALKEMPTQNKDNSAKGGSEETKPAAKKGGAKLREKTFKQKVRDAFIAEEVHDIKSYVVFDVIIPAIKTTFRNLIVNSLDISLFGKVSKGGQGGKTGGGSYISYDRAYRSERDQPPTRSNNQNAIDVREIDRVWFETREDAEEQIRVIRDIYDYNEGVLSVAEFLDAAQLKATPIHTKWGWIDISNVSAEPYPDGSGWYVNLPKPRPL